MSSDRGRGPRGGPTGAFGKVLDRLKRNGCNLLVTGEIPETVGAHVTRRLLGASSADRKRIVALTDATSERLETRLPYGIDRGDPNLWTVDQRYGQRSVVPVRYDADDCPDWGHESDLHGLRAEIVEAVGWFAEASDGLDPAQLRLAVDSLNPFVERLENDEIRRVLRPVAALVRGVSGMAHYHLPVPDECERVSELGPLFDARIEVRQRDGTVPEQRWHVPRSGCTSEWVRI